MNELVSIYFKHEGSAYEALKQLVDVLGADRVIDAVEDIEYRRHTESTSEQLVMKALLEQEKK